MPGQDIIDQLERQVLRQLTEMAGRIHARGHSDDTGTGDSGRLRHDRTSGMGKIVKVVPDYQRSRLLIPRHAVNDLDLAAKRLTSRHWVA